MAPNNDNGRGNGPPDHAGPPAHVPRRRADRTDSGAIAVGDDRLAQLREQIDFGALDPIDEYLLLLMEGTDGAR